MGGGTAPGARNLINESGYSNILLFSSSSCLEGNYVGVDATGTQVAANYLGDYDTDTTGTYYIGVSGKGNDNYNPLSGTEDAAASSTGPYPGRGRPCGSNASS